MQVVIRSQPRKAWRWGNTIFPVFLAAVFIGAFGTPGSTKDAVFALSIGLPLAVVLSYGPCVYWAAVTATRRYELDRTSLRVWSRGRVVKEVPAESIVSLRMRNYVSGFSIFASPSKWLTWPSAVVKVRRSEGIWQTILLPEIILWGRDAMRLAEDQLREVLEANKSESC